MHRILIVEDQQKKREDLCCAITEVDPSLFAGVDCVLDAHQAIVKLKSCRYDTLILDINIPSRADTGVKHGAGLEVLSFIRQNNQAIVPGTILITTAYASAVEELLNEQTGLTWKLLRYSLEDPTWKIQLQNAIRFSAKNHRPPYVSDGHSYHFDLCIAVAVDEELNAVLKTPGNWKQISIAHDSGRYWTGSFQKGDKALTVALGAAELMGMPTASVLATKLIQAFRPRHFIMAGFCAGVASKVSMGDLLIADPCFDWGSGKWRRNKKTKALEFAPAPYQWRADVTSLGHIRALSTETDFLKQLRQAAPGKKPAQAPKVHIGPMGSGGSVLQASILMDEVKEQHKNLIGVDMEIYGVFTAANYCSTPRPTCLSIKSVCDFGDEEKADGFHEYAASVSANFIYKYAVDYLLGD